MTVRKAVRILGIRGIPDRHGGFESFAQDLAPFLARRGWDVTVYCQEPHGETREDWWQGVRLVRIPSSQRGAVGTIAFDWRSTRHASRSRALVLVLGYNTAIFNAAYRLRGIPSLLNMDGVEWRRQKYNWLQRAWLLVNERIGPRLADYLVADHPVIEARYAAWRGVGPVAMVPYGARAVYAADSRVLARWQLTSHRYALVIARPEPENSIVEIVRAWSERLRGQPLVVLGSYDRRIAYQRRVLDAAGGEVVFPGAIYERASVDALRRFATLYIHGHQVGGTNPSLVEALGAAAAVLAHDNAFNRWVCADAAVFFRDERQLAIQLDRLLTDESQPVLRALRHRARLRHGSAFDLDRRLLEYEQVLLAALDHRLPASQNRSDAA